ncbi:MAG: AbrB/MazE/SpoVT family DNA-binding domain-containing protein [Thermoplasmata archaeon]
MVYATPNRERRVLKAGHSSIAVTLPKPWAEAMNLRPGDIVVFDQNDDGALYLKPAPAAGSGPVSSPYLVQAPSFDTPGVLTRLVVSAYRVGHDSIEIRTDVPLSSDRLEELHAASRSLLGVSVVAQDPNRVLLQNFIDPSKYALPQLVQRMKMILIAFLDEAEVSLAGAARARRPASLREETDKVLALLVRQLFLASRDWSLARRIGSPDPRQLIEWRVVVHSLEELGELLARVAEETRSLPRGPKGASIPIGHLLGEVRAHLKTTIEAIMRPSLAAACEAYAETLRLRAEILEAAQQKVPGTTRSAQGTIFLALERSSNCLTALAEVAMDRAVAVGTETVLVGAA